MRHRKDAAAGRTLYRPDEIVHIVCRLKTGNVVFGCYSGLTKIRTRQRSRRQYK
ncbi:glycosyl transferase family 1 [Neisseria meningitidis]|uniref:Uncharacterized protein n=3 Tax=Neisseria meningitidis TaxID=487 RepID=E6MXS5_NEIMH|nr:hypothetical protein [Neisseria meningitidis]EFM04661.1 hypothetical protein HMPREF0602_0875 [Neisseria meningitidis ATCC 13091]EFV63616.1 hypothetical protein NMH_1483 [Neisseria meningitidis H44/76]MBH5542995.1 hypothetical protein [Neisseria meningitidis]MBH6131932.1 hypothetical protein [Neisseria meningitidis]MBH6250900.1 hypothetical protein [Neisseria meningitidis]